MKRLRGVNLGGWLLLERWITPGLFSGMAAKDEYGFMQCQNARQKLRQHQKNFITEADFKWLADNGINAVRIPVGYWILHGDTPYVSSIGRLDWAFVMAKKYDLSVVVCLHGAPGSQNGQDHSGKIGAVNWYRDKAYRKQTIDCLVELATRYQHHEKFWGLELLNEPRIGIFQWRLRRFYIQARRQLRPILNQSTRIIFHDAFTPRLLNGALCNSTKSPVVMDIHWYHFIFWLRNIFSLSVYWWVLKRRANLINILSRWQPIIIGEWSNMIAHQSINKYPSSRHRELLDENAARQIKAYRHAAGWFYWTYKTEASGDWNFRSLVEAGRMPDDWTN